jgi:hypothetical protein
LAELAEPRSEFEPDGKLEKITRLKKQMEVVQNDRTET